MYCICCACLCGSAWWQCVCEVWVNNLQLPIAEELSNVGHYCPGNHFMFLCILEGGGFLVIEFCMFDAYLFLWGEMGSQTEAPLVSHLRKDAPDCCQSVLSCFVWRLPEIRAPSSFLWCRNVIDKIPSILYWIKWQVIGSSSTFFYFLFQVSILLVLEDCSTKSRRKCEAPQTKNKDIPLLGWWESKSKPRTWISFHLWGGGQQTEYLL